ncbi:prephenate dehydrogenase [Flavisolibacter sp. BT320]|nr:prephenate dehydrogenase [Flavisolibacter longurius]
MIVTIVGVGLIGGSMALTLKEKAVATRIIGVDNNVAHQHKALELGLVDEIMDLPDAVISSDLVILAIPVNAIQEVVLFILDILDKQVVMDAGSTKSAILNLIKDHPKRGRFVATHPMWGTEYSGPEAAVKSAFISKATVICNKEETDADALEMVENIYKVLGMHLVYMNAEDHDVHVAYVSHISHITSFALANTVLEKEKEEEAIFELASGGFESTVRLAKSNPAMWVPIFKENRENVLDVLNEHISQLRKFKACLEKENYDYLTDLIEQANKIKRIIK